MQKKLHRIYSLLIILCFLSIVAFPRATYAHSPVVKTSPGSGTILERSPATIEVWFGDYVDIYKDSITITANKKVDIELEAPQFDPTDRKHIVARLKKPLPFGKYSISVNVISIDSHPQKSSFEFEIKNPNPSPEEQFENLQLDRMSPADGEIVATSPTQLDLWYTEAAKITAFGVFDDKGKGTALDEPVQDQADPRHYVVKVKEPLHKGSYSVHWYAGIGKNEKNGVYYFAVGEYTPIQTSSSIPEGNLFTQIKLQALGHLLSYLGLLILAGGTLFHVWIAKGTGDVGRWKHAGYFLYASSILGFVLELWATRSQMILCNLMNL